MSAKLLIVKNPSEGEYSVVSDLQKFGIDARFLVSSFTNITNDTKSFDPEIIIADFNSEKDSFGIEQMSALRSQSNVPFIYLTPQISREEMRRLYSARPSGMLIRPYKLIDLVAMIEVTRSQRG